jgi:hypothetical protein
LDGVKKGRLRPTFLSHRVLPRNRLSPRITAQCGLLASTGPQILLQPPNRRRYGVRVMA